MTDKSQLITIIIPFLNEEENLPIIYSRCENVSNKIHIQFEYLFIDDGSPIFFLFFKATKLLNLNFLII